MDPKSDDARSEAIAIFRGSNPRAAPTNEQQAAAATLVVAAVEAARSGGVKVVESTRSPGEFEFIGIDRRAFLSVHKVRGVPLVSEADDSGGSPVSRKQLHRIRYDHALEAFIGTEEDTTRHPVPGARKTYRSALVVLAEKLVDLMGPKKSG